MTPASLCFAICQTAAASVEVGLLHPAETQVDPLQAAQATLEKMAAHPTDWAVQKAGCEDLGALVHRDSGSEGNGQQGVHNMLGGMVHYKPAHILPLKDLSILYPSAVSKLASQRGCWPRVMHPGPELPPGEFIQANSNIQEEVADFLTAMDAAAGRALAAQHPRLAVAEICLHQVTRELVCNRPLTLLVNQSTRAMEHIIQMLKRFPHNRGLNQKVAASYLWQRLRCCARAYTYGQSGFDALFAAIDRYADDPGVIMSALRGLSDHSHNPVGAEIIANHGGLLQGIGFLVGQLRAHPEPGVALGPHDQLTLQSQVMQIVSGLLEHDDGNVYRRLLVRTGFLQQLHHAMKVEPFLRGTQDLACKCMHLLLTGDSSVASALERLGAVRLASRAARHFALRPDLTPWCGRTLGAAFPVAPTCGLVLSDVELLCSAASGTTPPETRTCRSVLNAAKL